MARIPEGDDWRDHASACPNCGEAVMRYNEHYHPDTMTDPGWYSCDPAEDCENG